MSPPGHVNQGIFDRLDRIPKGHAEICLNLWIVDKDGVPNLAMHKLLCRIAGELGDEAHQAANKTVGQICLQ